MPKQLLVFGEKNFKIEVPDKCKITFGPFSPPGKMGYANNPEKAIGTLRIYGTSKDEILAVFAGVKGFRDLSLNYQEEVAREEGAVIWKSDKDGYSREEKVQRQKEWVDTTKQIEQ